MNSLKKKEKFLNNKSFWQQIFIIILPFFLFSFSATISASGNKSNILNVLIWDFTFFAIFFLVLFHLIEKNWISLDIKNIFQNSKGLLFLIIVVVLMRIPQIGTIPRWDSEAYFHPLTVGCDNFNFSISSFFKEFSLASHQCWGYSIFIAIGAFLTPYSIVGVNIINLILYCFYIYCIYRIFEYIFPSLSAAWLTLGTFLVSIEPMQLGTFSHLNLDYPLMVFSTYIAYAHIRKKYILMTFFSVILLLSKEPGIVVILGGLLGLAFFRLLKNKIENGKFQLKTVLKDKAILSYVVCLSLVVVYQIVKIIKNNLEMWGHGVKFGTDNLEIQNNYIAFNFDYIILKIKTIFLFNCYWIATIIIAVLLIYNFIIFIREKRTLNINVEVASYLCHIAAMLVFSFLFITYNNPRYNLILEGGLFFILSYFLLKLHSDTVRIILCIFCSVWFVAESYTTLDPVTNILFEQISTGKDTYIVHPVWDNNSYLADTSVYNNQSDYMDKAYEKLLSEAKYDKNTNLLIFGNYNLGVRAVYLEGRYMTYYWNSDRKKRTLQKSESTFPISILNEADFKRAAVDGTLKEKAIAIFTPQYSQYYDIDEEHYINELSKYYDIGLRKSVSITLQGEVYYYCLTLKNQTNREE